MERFRSFGEGQDEGDEALPVGSSVVRRPDLET